jgi:outer membrane biosynthesis protein TonB
MTAADDFPSESVAPEAPNPICLQDILSLRVPIHWSEAVAVVQGLCAMLGDDEPLVPQLQDVLITSHGSVLIRRGAERVAGADELGHRLHALLDPAGTPVPLRLFVAHAIGSDRYGSVGAYAEALAVYARPGGEGLVQALYRRCVDTEVAVLPQPPSSPVHEEERPPARRRRRIATWVTSAAAVLFLAGGGLVALWLFRHDARVAAPAGAVRQAVSAAATAIQQQFGLSAATRSPDVPVEKGDIAPRSARRPARAAASPREDLGPRFTVTSPALAGLRSAATATLPGEGIRTEGGFAFAPLSDAPTLVDRAALGRIYSAADREVQPPVIYSPKLPPVAAVDPRSTGTNTMELLIDESGEVAQVNLVSKPERMSDMTLLSAAKTWKFHPAIKSGSPVKYRLSMSWNVTPR